MRRIKLMRVGAVFSAFAAFTFLFGSDLLAQGRWRGSEQKRWGGDRPNEVGAKWGRRGPGGRQMREREGGNSNGSFDRGRDREAENRARGWQRGGQRDPGFPAQQNRNGTAIWYGQPRNKVEQSRMRGRMREVMWDQRDERDRRNAIRRSIYTGDRDEAAVRNARRDRRDDSWAENRERYRDRRDNYYSYTRRYDLDRNRFQTNWFYSQYRNRYRNYGQYRSRQAHRRNAERRDARYWARYNKYYRDRDRYRFERRVLRDRLLRRLMLERSYYRSYASRYYEPVAYYPVYSEYAPYSRYASYAPYSREPRYIDYDYDDDDYAYDRRDQDDTYYYASPSNSIGAVLGSLPLADIIGRFTGNGLAGEMVSGFLSQAYYQGYQAGSYADRNGYRDVYYDPYDHDPGSYSENIAENRRIFSEGYSLGYRDAMEGRQAFEPYAERTPDLLSLFVGSML